MKWRVQARYGEGGRQGREWRGASRCGEFGTGGAGQARCGED